MEKLQKKVVRCVGNIISNTLPHFPEILPLFSVYILKFQDIFELKSLKQMHLYFYNMIPQPIRELFVRNEKVSHYNTRSHPHKWNAALGEKKFKLFIRELIFGPK